MFAFSSAQVLSCLVIFAAGYLSIEDWRNTVSRLFSDQTPYVETSACGILPALRSESDQGALPTLIIHKGESPAGRDNNAVKALLEEGRSGEFPVATNLAIDPFLPYVPASRGGENSLLYSIESPIPLAITLSYSNQEDLLWDKKFVGDIFELTLFQIQSLPLFKNAVARVASAQSSGPVSSLIQRINEIEFVSGFNFVTHEDLRKLLNRAYFIWDHVQTKSEFITSLHKAIIEIANERYLTELGGKPLPAYVAKEQRHLIYGPSDPGTRPAALQIGIEIRNRDLAKNILDLACAYRGQYDSVGVVLSHENFDGVVERLSRVTKPKLEILGVNH